MKVFISWSGEASRDLALALRDWFPRVLQDVKPFVSSKDIDKGSTWITDLRKELADSSFGVVCLTPENILSPWLNYEAGAIATSLNVRVCPVLLGVGKNQVNPPLSLLQMTDLTVEDMSLLMDSMNKADGSPLSDQAVRENVGVWWPYLEKSIELIPIPNPNVIVQASPEPPQPKMPVEEILEELLRRMRRIEDRLLFRPGSVQIDPVEVAIPPRPKVVKIKEVPYESVYAGFPSRIQGGPPVIVSDEVGRTVTVEEDNSDEPPF